MKKLLMLVAAIAAFGLVSTALVSTAEAVATVEAPINMVEAPGDSGGDTGGDTGGDAGSGSDDDDVGEVDDEHEDDNDDNCGGDRHKNKKGKGHSSHGKGHGYGHDKDCDDDKKGKSSKYDKDCKDDKKGNKYEKKDCNNCDDLPSAVQSGILSALCKGADGAEMNWEKSKVNGKYVYTIFITFDTQELEIKVDDKGKVISTELFDLD